MRISVTAGFLVCAIIFTATPNKASAEALSIPNINQNEISAVEIIVSEAKEEIMEAILEETVAEKLTTEHLVAENESLSVIAKKYDTTWQRIYDKNESLQSPDIINPGVKLIIPEESEELTPRELSTAPVVKVEPVSTSKVKGSYSTASSPSRSTSSDNRYVAGYCTWYVKSRRPDMPNNLGNASSWVSRASSQGYATGSTPRAGAVGQRGNHVVYVESLNADGTVNISDMNYRTLHAVTYRTVSAGDFTYIY